MFATQFCDKLYTIHYHNKPTNLPAACDGWGAEFSLKHAKDCRIGELIKADNDLMDSIK